MNDQTPARRRYLAAAVSVVSALSCGAWPLITNAASPADATRANLLSLVTQPDAKWVGQAVLPQLGHPTAAALVQKLELRLAKFSCSPLAGPCDSDTLHLAFQQAVQADFAEGRCLSVSGWVLATSEVELCALAALSAQST